MSKCGNTVKKIFVFFGMTASGKSTIGQAFAEVHGVPYYNTDRVRKELAGLEVTSRRPDGIGKGIYSAEFTARTYGAMVDNSRRELGRGIGVVVLDGSYSKQVDRKQVVQLAEEVGGEVVFVLCHCSDQEVQRRLSLRSRDPESVSDGRWEIYLHQKETFEYPDELAPEQLFVLDTEQERDVLLSTLKQMLPESFISRKSSS